MLFTRPMEVTRDIVRWFTVLCGLAVLLSYVYGVSKLSEPAKLWGGVPGSWQTYIIPFMFVAAVGYLIYWWVALFQLETTTLEHLRWPWGESDGSGLNRLLLAYALFLIPSALWLESTSFHIANNYSWTPILVVGILLLASIGNVMLGLLAYGAYQDNVAGSGLMIIGAFMISIQCILNDLIIWSVKFPWNG